MNTKIKFARFVFALALTISALGDLHICRTWPLSRRNLSSRLPRATSSPTCVRFQSALTLTLMITEIDFLNASGALTSSQWHVAEHDTFSANGKTLVGLPFSYYVLWLPDSSGNLTPVFADGVVEKIPLPDGSLFISAGRVDYAAHPGVWILSADKGNPGNVGRVLRCALSVT